jgi:branched-chain amino acid transport system substrate-binding protein
MRGRLTAIVGVCSAIVMSVAACSSSGSPAGASSGSSASSSGSSSGGTYNVFAVEALSGPDAPYGQAAGDAVKAAVDVINNSGGVLGHKVVLTMKDDAGDPTTAVTLLESELAGATKPNLVVPGLFSTETVPLVPITTKAGILTVAPGDAQSLDDPAKYPLHFSSTPLGSSTAAALIAEMKSKGYTKLGIAVTDDEASVSTESYLEADAKAADMTYTAAQLSLTAVDATPQLEQLMAAKPQVVIFVMDGASNGVLLRSRATLGWTVPFYTNTAGTSFNVGAQVPTADWKNVYLQAQSFLVYGNPETQTPQFKTFSAALSKYVPQVTQGMALYVNPYDPLLVWAAAANKAKSVDPQKVAAAIQTLTNSSQVPNYVGQGTLYGGDAHFPNFTPSDFVYVPVGPYVDGLVKPTT